MAGTTGGSIIGARHRRKKEQKNERWQGVQVFFRTIAGILALALLGLNIYVEWMPRYAVTPLIKLAFAFLFAILLGVALLPGGKNKQRRRYIFFLFLYYLWVLGNLLFFDNALGRGLASSDPMQAVNFEPLHTIRNYLSAYRYGRISLYFVLLNLEGNLAAFAPMGFFLPALFGWERSISFFVLSLLHAITTVEVVQVYTGVGSFDVDDIILNLSGAVLVYFILRITPLWKHVCRITPRESKRRGT